MGIPSVRAPKCPVRPEQILNRLGVLKVLFTNTLRRKNMKIRSIIKTRGKKSARATL